MLSDQLDLQNKNGSKNKSKKHRKQQKHMQQLQQEQERTKYKQNGINNTIERFQHKIGGDVLQTLKANFLHMIEEDIITMVYENCQKDYQQALKLLQGMCQDSNNQQQQQNQDYEQPDRIKDVDSDYEQMDDYDREEVSSFMDHGVRYDNDKDEDDDFKAMMSMIDNEQPSFLRLSSREYKYILGSASSNPDKSFSFSYKDQQKLLEKQQTKQLKKLEKDYRQQQVDQQQKRQKQHDNNSYNNQGYGQKQQYSNYNGSGGMTNGYDNNPRRAEDIKSLMKQFTIDREIIEEVYDQLDGNREQAFDRLEEIEERIVQLNDEDLLTNYNQQSDEDEYMIDESDYQVLRNQGLDPEYQEGGRKHLEQRKLNEKVQQDQDRKLAEELQRQEKEQRERESTEQLMQELNMSEEQFTDLKIQEMLRDFLYNYRFEQKIQKNSQKKHVSEKDLQMKKAKPLSINEQHVFKDFILWLQQTQFEILSKNAQIKLQLRVTHGISDEELKQPYQNNGSASKNTPGNPQKSNYSQNNANNNVNGNGKKQEYVKIDNKSEFPDLISEQAIQRAIKQKQVHQRMDMHNRMDMAGKKKFSANTAQQEQQLYLIQDIFKALEHDLIQEAYYAINDAELLKNLLKIAFPRLMTRGDQDYDSVFEKIFQFQQNREQAENKIRHQPRPVNINNNAAAGRNGLFFTDEILRRFKNMNRQRGKPQNDQQIYEQSRLESQKIYASRKHYLNEFKNARKTGNQQQMNFAEKEAERYRILYEQSLQKAQMQIFQMKNSVDTEDFFIDLHGIHLQEAITILNRRLQQIKVDLGNGKLEPNIGDGRNHVLKIVCGRGIHSKGRPVLKVKIPKFLTERSYEFHNFEDDGVVLVRLQA